MTIQVGELSTDTWAFHHDVAEFHFDDYQRLLHISGCTLRLACVQSHSKTCCAHVMHSCALMLNKISSESLTCLFTCNDCRVEFVVSGLCTFSGVFESVFRGSFLMTSSTVACSLYIL